MRGRTAVLVWAALSLGFAPAAHGQSVHLGPRFGLNFANNGGDIQNTKTRTAIGLGAALEVDFSRFFALEIDALFSMKGSRLESVVNNVPIEARLKLSYLEMPALLKLLVPVEGAALRPSLYGGPVLSVRTGCTIEQRAPNQTVSNGCTSPPNNLQTKALDFGLVAGAGLGFGLGPGTLGFDLRFGFGLTNINDTPASVQDLTNRVIQVMAGYVFPLGG